MEGLCLNGGDFETGITGLPNRSLQGGNIGILESLFTDPTGDMRC
jgi:hypothetical protein